MFFVYKIKDGCEEVVIKFDKLLRFIDLNYRFVVGKWKFILFKL